MHRWTVNKIHILIDLLEIINSFTSNNRIWSLKFTMRSYSSKTRSQDTKNSCWCWDWGGRASYSTNRREICNRKHPKIWSESAGEVGTAVETAQEGAKGPGSGSQDFGVQMPVDAKTVSNDFWSNILNIRVLDILVPHTHQHWQSDQLRWNILWLYLAKFNSSKPSRFNAGFCTTSVSSGLHTLHTFGKREKTRIFFL